MNNKVLSVTAGTVTLTRDLSGGYPAGISLNVSGNATVVFATDQNFANVTLSGNGTISEGEPPPPGTAGDTATGASPTPTPTPTSDPTPAPTPTRPTQAPNNGDIVTACLAKSVRRGRKLKAPTPGRGLGPCLYGPDWIRTNDLVLIRDCA